MARHKAARPGLPARLGLGLGPRQPSELLRGSLPLPTWELFKTIPHLLSPREVSLFTTMQPGRQPGCFRMDRFRTQLQTRRAYTLPGPRLRRRRLELLRIVLLHCQDLRLEPAVPPQITILRRQRRIPILLRRQRRRPQRLPLLRQHRQLQYLRWGPEVSNLTTMSELLCLRRRRRIRVDCSAAMDRLLPLLPTSTTTATMPPELRRIIPCPGFLLEPVHRRQQPGRGCLPPLRTMLPELLLLRRRLLVNQVLRQGVARLVHPPRAQRP